MRRSLHSFRLPSLTFHSLSPFVIMTRFFSFTGLTSFSFPSFLLSIISFLPFILLSFSFLAHFFSHILFLIFFLSSFSTGKKNIRERERADFWREGEQIAEEERDRERHVMKIERMGDEKDGGRRDTKRVGNELFRDSFLLLKRERGRGREREREREKMTGLHERGKSDKK